MAGRGAFVQGVKVEAGDFLVDEFLALRGGVIDSGLFDGLGVVSRVGEGFEEFSGKAATGGEFGHAVHACDGGDGHDAGDDGEIDPGD